MFRIGVLETGLTCALIFIALIIPIIIKNSYARMGKRLKNIEKKIDKERH